MSGIAQLAAVAYRGLFIWMIYQYRYFSPAGQSVFRVFAYVVLAHMLVGQGYQWLSWRPGAGPCGGESFWTISVWASAPRQ